MPKVSLVVRISGEGDEIVAEQEDFRLHAFGHNRQEAMANLRVALLEHLDELNEMGERLSPRLMADRDLLRALIILE